MGPAHRGPEASLQLALDVPSLGRSLALAATLRSRLARAEVGTPLLLHSGTVAIEAVRSVLDDGSILVADTKICDAGGRIAQDAFAAGADVVTVAGAAVDEPTWRGVLDAASAKPGAAGTVMIDTVGWHEHVAGPGLRELLAMAAGTGVDIEICIHRPKRQPPSFPDLLSGFLSEGAPAGPAYLVAGQVVGGLVQPALEAGFGLVIVGGVVSDANDPVTVWDGLLEEAARAQLDNAERAQPGAADPA